MNFPAPMPPNTRYPAADWPIGMDDAALMLRMSRRTLTSLIGRHPHYLQGGRRKVFEERDIAALTAAIREETGRRIASMRAGAHGKSGSRPMAVAGYEEALAWISARSPKPLRKRCD